MECIFIFIFVINLKLHFEKEDLKTFVRKK
jgi:hypothetical protein